MAAAAEFRSVPASVEEALSIMKGNFHEIIGRFQYYDCVWGNFDKDECVKGIGHFMNLNEIVIQLSDENKNGEDGIKGKVINQLALGILYIIMERNVNDGSWRTKAKTIIDAVLSCIEKDTEYSKHKKRFKTICTQMIKRSSWVMGAEAIQFELYHLKHFLPTRERPEPASSPPSESPTHSPAGTYPASKLLT